MTPWERALADVTAGHAPHAAAAALVLLMTPEERRRCLSGDLPFWAGLADMATGGIHRRPFRAATVPRLGIPGLAFSDGPRGVVVGTATCFPVSMARGATWDLDLEERIGEAIGIELRTVGANLFGGVCVNPAAPPRVGSRTGDVRRGRPRRGGDGRCPDQQVRHMMLITGAQACSVKG